MVLVADVYPGVSELLETSAKPLDLSHLSGLFGLVGCFLVWWGFLGGFPPAPVFALVKEAQNFITAERYSEMN